ncbi:MAG: FecR family protein [Flagellimonas sp.]
MTAIKSLWEKYIEGKASQKEKRKLLQAIDDQDAEFDEIFLNRWEAAQEVLENKLEIEQARKKLHSEIDFHTIRIALRYRYGVAASIAALLTLSFFLYTKTMVNAMVEISVASGDSVKEVVLPDGSTVWVNNGSLISYAEDFGVENRSINLRGNAFFEVVKDSLKPFLINTGKLNVKVLGTSFDVYSFMDEPTRVSVKTGKVEVLHTKSKSKIELIANEQSSFDSITDKMVKKKVGFDQSLWRDNILQFENLRLKYVLKRIERKYDVRFKCDDSVLLQSRVRASYENETLNAILSDLAFMINFEVSKNKENEITLNPLDMKK